MHTPSPSLAAPRRRQRLVLLLTAVTLAALVLLGGSLAEAQPGRGGFGSDIADMLGSTAFSRSSAANDGHGAPICVNNSRGGTPWLLVDEDTFDGAEVDRSTWILYDSPGNAGFGLRRPEVITVEDGLLTITAQMIDGRLVSGGMAHTVDQTYGRWEFRVRTDPDPSGATSGVVLTWPQSENWPIDGENDMYETGRDPDRMPFHTYIHYGADNRQEIITHPADGTEWHVMAMEWTADRITMFRDGAYAGQVTRPEVIPDVPHHMTVQLDAWADTMGEPVTMEVDWIRVYTADTDSQCQETTPSTTTSTTTTSSTVAPSTTSTTSTTSTSTTSTTVAPTTTTTTSPTSSSTIAPATSTTVAPTTTSTTVRSTSTAPSITTTTTSTAPSITTTTTSTSSTTAPEPSTTTPSPSTTSTTVAPTTTTTTVAPTEITTPPALNIEPCRVVDGELELNGCVGFLVVPVLFAESSSPDDAEDPDDPIDPAPAANPDDAAEPEAAPENADPDPIDAEDPDSDPVDRREPDAGDDPADNGGPDTDQPVSEEQPDDTEEPGTAVPGDADEPAAEEPGTEDPDQVGEPASADPDAGDSGDAGGEAPASAGSHAVGPGSCSTYRPMAPVGSGVVHTASTQSELNAALGRAKPGDVINLDTGTYTRLHLSGDAGHEAGTSGAPIVIQAARGATPVIENDTTDVRDMKARTVYVAKSQHIVVRGLRVVGGAVGMTVADSDHVVIEHNDVVGSGDAGIAVQSFWDRTGSSNHVRVRCNTISSIGYDQSDAYAEGIYLGHGNAPFDTGSSHIIVSRNEITDVLADGIDVKAGVTDVLITANHIHDLDFSATSFGRAITLAADNRSFSDAGYRVEGNVIERISSARNDDAIGILIGHGDTVIRNNVVSDIEDAAIAAQRHGSRFGWGNPDERDVAIHNNTLWNCGSTCLLDRGSRAVIDARNNFASDPIEPGAPTAAADDFVGPLDRTSDAGGGPGTAFALADTSAAVDAGTTLTFVSDLLRVSRPQGATWDLGALERVAEASEPANPLVSA